MDKLFNTDLTIEKMAAYLDGNLSDTEMQRVTNVLLGDVNLLEFTDAIDQLDAAVEDYESLDFELPAEIAEGTFALPEIESMEDFSNTNDSFLHPIHSIPSDITNENEGMHNRNNPSFGHLTADDIKQSYPDTCAIKAQQLILESHNISVSEKELVDESEQKGWYVPGHGGTDPNDVGNLLQDHGMTVYRFDHPTFEDLVAEFSKGHQIIVGVDAGELWNPGRYETFEDFLFSHADHALIFSGIQINPLTAAQEVILTDTGTGEVAHVYSLDQFLNAWDDSNNFMITTELIEE